MLELLETYTDSGFVDALVSLSPAVGAGLVVGIVAAIVGWVAGLVMRMGKVEL